MKKLFEYVLLTIGSIIVAGSLELILAPNGLVDGGVTAIAIMANKSCRITALRSVFRT